MVAERMKITGPMHWRGVVGHGSARRCGPPSDCDDLDFDEQHRAPATSGSGETVKLPNASAARVDVEKLTEYLLSETHPVGKYKARFFRKLGFHRDRPEMLLAELLKLARSAEVVDHVTTPLGKKYVMDGTLTGPVASAMVRTVWIIERNTAMPRLVTAYPAPAEGA
jgi:hypothetical protein